MYLSMLLGLCSACAAVRIIEHLLHFFSMSYCTIFSNIIARDEQVIDTCTYQLLGGVCGYESGIYGGLTGAGNENLLPVCIRHRHRRVTSTKQ